MLRRILAPDHSHVLANIKASFSQLIQPGIAVSSSSSPALQPPLVTRINIQFPDSTHRHAHMESGRP